jgi:hypothetical protein
VMICSKVFSGISSTFSNTSFKYKAVANLNPPFEIFCVRIFPANS